MGHQFDSFVADWLSYHSELERQGYLTKSKEVGSQYFGSIDSLDEMVRTDPEDGWNAIQMIFSGCETDFQRACLAGGLLEDLLAKHGPQFIDRIESAAKTNEGFRELLTGVWRNTIDNVVWERVERLRAESK